MRILGDAAMKPLGRLLLQVVADEAVAGGSLTVGDLREFASVPEVGRTALALVLIVFGIWL